MKKTQEIDKLLTRPGECQPVGMPGQCSGPLAGGPIGGSQVSKAAPVPKYVVLDFLADLFAENKEVDDDGFTRGRGVLNQDAWDRCQGHSLAAQEREYWPQYVEALRNGPKSLWDVSMAVYGTGNPQSGAIGVLLLAGVLSCKGNNKLSGDAWLKAVICKLKPEALA